jgi:2-iminobutanoate/2-iminopropanoate deaminase
VQDQSIEFITDIPNGAPALGPYSPATTDGRYLFISGQTPYDPGIGRIHRGTIAEQTRLVLENIERILHAAGATKECVLSCRIYLQDLNPETFGEMNAVYGAFFGGHKPARATIGCDLLGMDVEIEAIAIKPQS